MAKMHPSLDPRAHAPKRARWSVTPTSASTLKRDPSALPWTVKRNGDVMGTFHKQTEAVAFAVTACRSAWQTAGQTATLKLHGQDGRIRWERTYPRSSDPQGTAG